VLDSGFIYAWAWIDEDAGLIRARSFVPEVGVAEDEATGSAALRVCAEVGRPIEVRQGRGSVIWAQPIDDGFVEIGGFVVED
jgi:predicted PhzF superfamily epimerase YddE/YHI9